MEYYKRLNKRRKFAFWLFLIGGSLEVALGIFIVDIPRICFGLVLMAECFNLITNQINDDVIANYEKTLKHTLDGVKTTMKTISKLIEKKDEKSLQSIAEKIDSWYKEEEIDVSNEG